MGNNYSFNVYDPMLVGAKPNNYRDLLKNEKIIGTIKKDGYFYQLIKENNQVYLFSRSKSKVTDFYSEKIDNVPHIKQWAMDNLPNGTCLIGEIYYPGGTSKDVTKIMGCLPERAAERQAGEYGNIHYYLHDILKYNGYDYVINEIPYSRRYSDLCSNIDISTDLIPEIEVACCYDNTYLNLEKTVYDKLDEGEEGMVFRTENGLYLPGKRRPQIMFKIKQEVNDIDLVITDILDPEEIYTGKELETWPYWEEFSEYDNNGKKHSSFWSIEDALGEYGAYYQHKHNPQWYKPVTKAYYYGWKNAFKLGAYNSFGDLVNVGRVASGITDEMKADMADNPENYIGKVCEIQAMSVDKDNLTFRHPIFVQMRPDKDAKQCRISEIFN